MKLTRDMVKEGRTQCIGDGEVATSLYYDRIVVGEEIRSNGTRYGETAGEIHSVRWFYNDTEELPDNSVLCSECGEVVYVRDDQYSCEWPNSSDLWIDQMWDDHNKACPVRQEEKAQEEKMMWDEWHDENNIPCAMTPHIAIRKAILCGQHPKGISCPPDRYPSRWLDEIEEVMVKMGMKAVRE